MSESEDHNEVIIFLIFLGLIISFIYVGSYMEAKSFIFGHETTFVILAGMLLSYIIYTISPDEDNRIVAKFNSELFFDLLLPTILFAVGFNMRRKEFFKNFVNITKFGIFGSLFTFFIYVGLTKLFFTVVNVQAYDPKTKEYVPFELEWLEIFLVCSLLVSSDIIAAMSILKFDEAPHIYSIIIGEGLLNDVVVIVLYQTCLEAQPHYNTDHSTYGNDPAPPDPHANFGWKDFFDIIGKFCLLCIISVLIGMLGGFLITYTLKRFRSVSHSAVHETFLLICAAMFTYFTSELLEQSGITSLVTCALVEAHYTWFNLSPQGKYVTSVTF